MGQRERLDDHRNETPTYANRYKLIDARQGIITTMHAAYVIKVGKLCENIEHLHPYALIVKKLKHTKVSTTRGESITGISMVATA